MEPGETLAHHHHGGCLGQIQSGGPIGGCCLPDASDQWNPPVCEESYGTLEDIFGVCAGHSVSTLWNDSMADPAAALSLAEACWRNVVLGVVQGLTEFLPISSTAHLKAVPVLLGWGDPGVSVTAAIQLGSIVAVIAYFRSDLSQVLRGIGPSPWPVAEPTPVWARHTGTLPILANQHQRPGHASRLAHPRHRRRRS